MMSKCLTALVCVLALATASHAYTITFDDLSHPGPDAMDIPFYNSGDFHLAAFTNYLAPSIFRTPGEANPEYGGSASLWNANYLGITELTRHDNSAFSLDSIDLLFRQAPGAPVTFNAHDESRAIVGSVSFIVDAPTWITFNFNDMFASVHMVSWNQVPPYHQFDNIVLDSGDEPGPLPAPEPSTFVLLGAGLLGLIGIARKRIAKA